MKKATTTSQQRDDDMKKARLQVRGGSPPSFLPAEFGQAEFDLFGPAEFGPAEFGIPRAVAPLNPPRSEDFSDLGPCFWRRGVQRIYRTLNVHNQKAVIYRRLRGTIVGWASP